MSSIHFSLQVEFAPLSLVVVNVKCFDDIHPVDNIDNAGTAWLDLALLFSEKTNRTKSFLEISKKEFVHT